jgi:hypothetical protein
LGSGCGSSTAVPQHEPSAKQARWKTRSITRKTMRSTTPACRTTPAYQARRLMQVLSTTHNRHPAALEALEAAPQLGSSLRVGCLGAR